MKSVMVIESLQSLVTKRKRKTSRQKYEKY